MVCISAFDGLAALDVWTGEYLQYSASGVCVGVICLGGVARLNGPT